MNVFISFFERLRFLITISSLALGSAIFSELKAQLTFSWDFTPCSSHVISLLPTANGWVGCQRIYCDPDFSAHMFRIEGEEIVNEVSLEYFTPLFFFELPTGFLFMSRTEASGFQLVRLDEEFEVMAIIEIPFIPNDLSHLIAMYEEDGELFAVYLDMLENSLKIAQFTVSGDFIDVLDFGVTAPVLATYHSSIHRFPDGSVKCAIDCAHYVVIDTQNLSDSQLFLSDFTCSSGYMVPVNETLFFGELWQFTVDDFPSDYSGYSLIQRDPSTFQVTSIIDIHEDGINQIPSDMVSLEDGSLLFSVVTYDWIGTYGFRFTRTDADGTVLVNSDYSLPDYDMRGHRIAIGGDSFGFYGFKKEIALEEQYHAHLLIYPKNEILVNVVENVELSSFDLQLVNGELLVQGHSSGPYDFRFYNTSGQCVYAEVRSEGRCGLPNFAGGMYIATVTTSEGMARTKLFLQPAR